MKKLVPVRWIIAGLMLFTSVAFADAKMRSTDGLQSAVDGTKAINWQAETVAPTNTRDIDLAYHDGSFEGQLGVNGGGAGFGVRFTPPGPVFLTGLTLYFQGDAGVTAGVVSVYADPDASVAGPPTAPTAPGDPAALWESDPMDLSSPDGSLVTITIPLENVPVNGGDFYVVVWDDGGFMGIANDLQMNHLDRNWVTLGAWSTLNDATAGDPTLTGNFGITATYMPQDIEGSYMVVAPTTLNFGVLQIDDGAVTQDVTISNLGNAPFDITAINITGADLTTNLTAPVTVAAETAVTMEVTLTPTAEGPFTGSVDLTSDADNATSATVDVSTMVYDGFPEFMVWNPSGSISGSAFVSTLEGLGYTAFETTDIFQFGPPVGAGYTAVFVTLGIFSDNYELVPGSAEVGALVDYVNAGGAIYMEGGDTWAYDDATALHAVFNIDGVSDGSGDLTSVEGADFAEGMDYAYFGGNSFMDHLAPLTEESVTIHVNPADGFGCGVAFLSPNGNTIGTSFEFGGLEDGASTKAELLQAYLDFFALPYTDIVNPHISGVTRFDFTMDTAGPYVIEALITDNTELAATSLYYTTDGNTYTEVPMTDMGDDVYSGDIPGQPVGTTVGYYVMAEDTSGNSAVMPEEGTYAFSVLSALPPVNLRAESGLDGHSVLNWDPPGTTAPPQLDCADYVIDELPYQATGTTVGMGDDFDVNLTDNEDVAYQLYLPDPSVITISLCGGTDYDSKLEVFMDDCSTSTGYYNDDACGLQSELSNIELDAGTYLIVVDGFSSAAGNYTLDVTYSTAARSNLAQQIDDLGYEVQKIRSAELMPEEMDMSSASRHYYERNIVMVREMVDYGIYRSTTSPVMLEAGNLVGTTGGDTLATTYDDSGLVNGTTYYYRVSAIYDDDEAGSEEVSATPVNHPPFPPTNLAIAAEEGSLVADLTWDYPVVDYDFNHFAVYREGSIIGTTTDEFYTDTAPAGGNYHYYVVTVDNDDAESEPSNMVFVGLGNLPPLNLMATGNLDGRVELSWLAPNANPGEAMFESFEDGIPGDWTVEGIAGMPESDSWRPYVVSNAPDGAQVARAGDGQSGEFIDEWLITNDIPIGGLNSMLTFYHYATALSWDNAPNYLKISTDGGTTWETLLTWDPTGATPLPDVWTLEVVDLSSYTGSTVRLAWQYTSTYGEFWNLDAVELSAPARANRRALTLDNPVEQITDKSGYVENRADIIALDNPSGFTVSVNRERELTGYEVLRDGVSLTTLGLETLEYVDYDVTNGVEYCYMIVGLYPDGNSNSNESCAMPVNHPPAAPANLMGEADDAHNILIWWNANTDYDFASYNVYRDGELILNTTDTSYAENLPVSNVYTYQVTAIDAEDSESAPSNTLVLPVGNLPPSSLEAVSGLDGTILLHWTAPFGASVGNETYGQDFEGLDWPVELMTYDEDGDGLTWAIYYPGSDVGHDSPQSAGVLYNSAGNDDWLISPPLDVSGVSSFSFWASPQDPAYSEESFNVLVSTAGGTPADFIDEPVLSHTFPAGVGPDAYEEFSVDLADFGGSTVWVAIQCTSFDQFVLKVDDLAADGLTSVPGGALAMRTGMRNATLPYATRAEYERAVGNGYVYNAAPRTMLRDLRENLATYSIYRSMVSPVTVDVGNFLATVDTLTFNYTDFPVLNDSTYYYVVTADYQTEQSASPEASATPMNHPPAAPMNLVGAGDELLNVTLDWDDNADYDLGFYRVYRGEELVGDDVMTSDFAEVVDSSGVYTYYVTAVDTQGMESDASEALRVAVGTLPPTNLMAESGLDGQVYLTWREPGLTGPVPLDCADEVIMDLPFSYVGTNAGFGDDFDVSGTDGEDIAFQIEVFEGDVFDVTLCSELTDYDTKVEIFNEDCMTSTGFYDDDGPFGSCPESPAPYTPSELLGVSLPAGNYLIVVDGFSGAVGNFELTVSPATMARAVAGRSDDLEMELTKLATLGMESHEADLSSAPILRTTVNTRSFDGFVVYRDGVAVSDTLPTDQLEYMDGYIPNGVEYCYAVDAVYTTATATSEEACATPVNHAPSTPTGLVGAAGDNHLVTLDWDDIEDYDLDVYHVYRNDTLIASVETSDYSEAPGVSNTYSYHVKSYDTGGMESERSNVVTLVVGEAPPLNLRADGNYDTYIELNWNAPGAGGVETEFRYDDGVVVGQLGFTTPGPNAVMGASWPVSATLNEVNWYLTAEGGPHDQVFIYILGLDAMGIPDVNQVLYVSEAVENTDAEWNDLEFDDPVEAPNGFFVGINAPNQFTGLAMDDGVGEPWVFSDGTMWGNADITAGNDWLDVGPAGFPQNFLVRAYGTSNEVIATNYRVNDYRATKEQYMQFGYSELSEPLETVNQPSLATASRELMREIASFNVYRDGDIVGNVTTDDLEYDDTVVENVDYLYYVTAVYDNGVESIPSNEVVARANMAPAPAGSFTATPSGHNVILEWTDPTVNADGSQCIDLEGLKLYRDGTYVADIDPFEWYYLDTGLSDGPHTYELKAYDEVPNLGEPAVANAWIGPAPTLFTFEDGMPDGWTQTNPGEVPWGVGTAGDATSAFWGPPDNGSLIAYINDDAPGSGADGNNTLVTGAFDLGNSDEVTLIFDTFFDAAYGSMANIEYRIGTGGSWQPLYTVPEVHVWATYSVDISALAGQTEVYLGFHHDDGGGWAGGWAIDNVEIQGLVTAIMGDLNGDGELHVDDLTRMIEIILHMGDTPTPDEMMVMDVNGDGMDNVLDAVMLVEMILDSPTLAKPTTLPTTPVEVKLPDVKLTNNTELWQEIPVHLDYNGELAGFQATISYDANRVELGTPVLANEEASAQVFSANADGELRVILLNPMGGTFQAAEGLLLSLPVRVKSEETGVLEMDVTDVVLGASGLQAIENSIALGKIEVEVPLPTTYALAQNYPNPFNPTTTIKYQMPKDARVTLVVYNMLGQVVTKLVNQQQTAGYYQVQWNGLNDRGQMVPTGIYIYQ
ncbi:MAG: choice-of-anchor J domain-containing protein, partial [Lentisphaeria bacterium]|nr:choice-of-anchor J domain-containing protein [Lentisphaeria bacterium]